jgi:KipI family sensor histidine kinase inhibitor
MSGRAAPRVLPAGDGALLLEFDTAREVAQAHARITAAALKGVLEVVPAARTVFVSYDPGIASAEEVTRPLFAAAPESAASATAAGATAEIPVVYDGPDLPGVAAATGLSVDEVVARHCAPLYVVAFCGFAPGFGYLDGLDPLLRLPRRGTPRTRVPAGSVAIAGEFAGIYPNASPGGWHLLGRTDAVLWDLERDPPALLAPGTRVRFRPLPAAQAGGGR